MSLLRQRRPGAGEGEREGSGGDDGREAAQRSDDAESGGARGRDRRPLAVVRVGFLLCALIAAGLVVWDLATPQRFEMDCYRAGLRKDLLQGAGGRGRIVVIGSGLAGMCAALTALEHGIGHVVVVEKNPFLGGNSAKATSGMNAVNRATNDSAEVFEEDTVKAGHHVNDIALVERVSYASEDARNWLKTRFDLALDDATRLGGHSQPRTWRFFPGEGGRPRPVGWTIISALKAQLLNDKYADRVRVMTSTSAERLEIDGASGAVHGVDVRSHSSGGGGGEQNAPEEETVFLPADAVILATGGYCAGRAMLRAHATRYAQLPTTNGAWATGDGIQLGQAVGAAARDLEYVQVHPTSFLNVKRPYAEENFLAPEALRGCGGVLVDNAGQRFVDELAPRDHVTEEIFRKGFLIRDLLTSGASIVGEVEATDEEAVAVVAGAAPRKAAFLILSERMMERFGLGAAGFYASKGLLFQFDGMEAAEKALGVAPPGTLRRNLDEYAELARRGNAGHGSGGDDGGSDAFGKDHFPLGETFLDEPGKIWVGVITPALHYSMGGLDISPSAEILRAKKAPQGAGFEPIPGLFGAGEVTGGMHGANRLAGNSLLECTVVGRIAGERAASMLLPSQDPPILPDAWTEMRIRSVEKAGDDSKGYLLCTVELPSVNQSVELAVGDRVAVRTRGHAPVLCPVLRAPLGEVSRGVLPIVVRTELPGVRPSATVEVLGPISSLRAAPHALEGALEAAQAVSVVVSGDRLADLLPLAFHRSDGSRVEVAKLVRFGDAALFGLDKDGGSVPEVVVHDAEEVASALFPEGGQRASREHPVLVAVEDTEDAAVIVETLGGDHTVTFTTSFAAKCPIHG